MSVFVLRERLFPGERKNKRMLEEYYVLQYMRQSYEGRGKGMQRLRRSGKIRAD
jgi:hypothetical protein